jgi:F0F1-type ATP synthase assembly protein I
VNEIQNQSKLAKLVATVLVQVGCVTLFLALIALLLGLWIDERFNTRPLFTLILIMSSVPVSGILIFRIVRRATSHLQQTTHQGDNSTDEEELYGARK